MVSGQRHNYLHQLDSTGRDSQYIQITVGKHDSSGYGMSKVALQTSLNNGPNIGPPKGPQVT